MNKTNALILFAVFAISQLFSCHAENDCEGVTVGECTPGEEDEIQTVDIFTDVRDCQFYCGALTNCELFRFNGTHCTLLTKDYRKDCQVVAGPFDKQIDQCFEIDNKFVCDLFLQEDCGYNGDVLLEPPVGTIADPKECEQLCDQFESLGCKYWVFSNTAKLCSLRLSDNRNCQTWAGPRAPSFDSCQEDSSSSAAPTTGASTTAAPPNPTTAAPTTKVQTTKKDPTTEAETITEKETTPEEETTTKVDPTTTAEQETTSL